MDWTGPPWTRFHKRISPQSCAYPSSWEFSGPVELPTEPMPTHRNLPESCILRKFATTRDAIFIFTKVRLRSQCSFRLGLGTGPLARRRD